MAGKAGGNAPEAIQQAARDAGVNFIDTADVYAKSESEKIVGKLIAADRDHWVLATKVGNPSGDGPNQRGTGRKRLLQAIDQSLDRLGTDYVDVYYLHKDFAPENEVYLRYKAAERELQAIADGKAVVTRAEGAKQAAILEAEARLESSKRDANARVMLAEASAEAIRRVASAVGTDTTPMLYMLGEKYIASLERMGSTDNAKVVVLPADLQEAVRGLFGGATRR